MARLPDDTFFGNSPSDEQRAFWLDGAAPFDTFEQEKALAEFNKLKQDANEEIKFAGLRTALNGAGDLEQLKETVRNFEQERAVDLKSFSANIAQGRQGSVSRRPEIQALIDARIAELTRKQEIAGLDGLLKELSQSALQSSGPEAVKLIDTGTNLINRALAANVVDAATAQRLGEETASLIAKKRVGQLRPEDRLTLLAEGALGHVIPQAEIDNLRREAQSELDRQNTERVFARARHYEDGFDRALNDGAPPPSGEDIALDPALDAPSRARLEQRREKTAQELADFSAFKARFDDPTAGPIDIDDPRAGKSADKLYRMLGANPAAAYLIANRTGRIPPSVAAELNGGIASDDPTRLMPTIDLATRLAKDHPDALTMAQGGDDIRNTATQYWHSIEYGATPDQAVKRIIEMRSPEYQDAWAARSKNRNVGEEVAKAISPNDVHRALEGNSYATAIMFPGYRDWVKERYLATGDLPLAKAQALDQLKRVWELIGVTAGDTNASDTDRHDIVTRATTGVVATNQNDGPANGASTSTPISDQAAGTQGSFDARDPKAALRRYVDELDAQEALDGYYGGFIPQSNGYGTQAAEPVSWEQFDQSLDELPLKPHQKAFSFILRSYKNEIYENLKFVNDVMNGAYEAKPEVPGWWSEEDESRAIQLKEAKIRGTNRLTLFAFSGSLSSLLSRRATLGSGPTWRPPASQKPGLGGTPLESKSVQAVREAIPNYDVYAPKIKEIIEREKLKISLTPGVVIHDYTGPMYNTLNRATREDRATRGQMVLLSQSVKGIEEGASRQLNLFRASEKRAKEAGEIWNNAQKGKSFDPGYQLQSYTLDKNLAVKWSQDGKLIYHIRETDAGAYIAALSQFPRQREVLLPPGLIYTVVDKRVERVKDSLVKIIELEVKRNAN